MILQRLVAFYDRLLGEGQIESPGFQKKEIPWIIEIDASGNFVALRQTGDGRRGGQFVVPYEVQRTGDNIVSNLLWDNPEYILGTPRPDLKQKQTAKVPRRHAAFLERLRTLPTLVRDDAGVKAVLLFLERAEFDALKAADGWNQMTEGGKNVSFRLVGDEGLVCERPVVKSMVTATTDEVHAPHDLTACMVTGENAPIALTHNKIKGVRGAQTSGANLVSFNLDAFKSHGWEQGDNAPIGGRAAKAYVAALNRLLERSNDRHHLVEGEATFVFWAARQTAMEDKFAHLLGGLLDTPAQTDGTTVKQTFDSVRKGLKPDLADETPFYVLGLAPNASRLAIRFWHEGTVREMAERILRHFADLDVDGLWGRERAPSLWSMLGAAARNSDPKQLQKNLRAKLAAELMVAMLAGGPYPATLLARVVDRCRAEHSVSPMRAALIKATLNRRCRILRSTDKEVTVSLDPENSNPGYRLGRLFAVLEDIQRGAQPGINTTIRDRYFGAAVSTPRAVFGELMKLKNSHLRKLRRSKPGLGIHFERLIDHILAGMEADRGFPSHLSLDDQGRFILGYHHQRSYRTAGATPGETEALPDLPDDTETESE